jgi:hypothetical protein
MKYGKSLLLSCLSFFIAGTQGIMNASQNDITFALNASYTIETSWPTGYLVTVTLTNNSVNPTSSWMSTFSLGQGQMINNLWNGEFVADSQNITVTNPSWFGGGVIQAGASTTFGFVVDNPQGSVQALNNLQATANSNSNCICPTLPVPSAPMLAAISPNQAGYTVSWNGVPNASSYVLQVAMTADFANPMVVAQGYMLSQTFVNQPTGTYFYRVAATNVAGSSPFSNVQSIAVNSQPTPPVASPFLIESYWESWDAATPVSDIVGMHVDTINIAFGNFADAGTPHTFTVAGVQATPAQLAQIVTLAHNAGETVKLAIGGATYPIAPQLQTTDDAMGMAQAIAMYVAQNNLDGVDFDIEDAPDADLQVALIQNTRQLLAANALISYTAKSPASTTAPYAQVIQAASQYLDDVVIMAYDYAVGYNYQQDVQALMAMGVPMSKIVVGLMPGTDDLGVVTSVTDVIAAAQYIAQNGLRGIMFWDLNRDLLNETGLGVSAATNAAWNVFHS